MKNIAYFILFLTPLLCCAQSKNDSLKLAVNGVEQKALSLEEIKKLKTATVEFYNYNMRKSEVFRGTHFNALLSSVLPEQIKKTVEVELVSSNGYKSYFPIENFSKVDAFVTYESAEGKFERYSTKEKTIVPLGPYYLVWDFKTLGTEDKNQYNSVYQITTINLITNIVDFGVHEIKNNDKLILGYRTYKKYCLSCHAIGTWGGDIGADLVQRKTLEKKGPDFIKKYVLNPQAVNPQTKMLALPKYKNSESMADGINEFLSFAGNPQLYIKDKKIDSDKARYESLKNIMEDMRSSKK